MNPHHTATALSLQGASNFRDIGGHTGLDGRRVRSGLVFRSDHLAGLTDGDRRHLQGLGLTHRIDFRGAGEAAALPSPLAGASTVALAIEPTVVARLQALLDQGVRPSEAQAVELMCHTYRAFARENAPTYQRFFQHLLNQPTPVVFHCTAGKDRTGFAAALLLGALGVHTDAVMADYLLTNALYRRSPLVQAHGPAEVVNVLWRVQPAFLQAAFDTIDSEFGGLAAYLAGPMGLGAAEMAALRGRLLEPVR